MKLYLTYYLILGIIYINLAVFLSDKTSLIFIKDLIIELIHGIIFILIWPIILLKDFLGIKISKKVSE